MNRILITLATGSLVFATGCNNGVAEDEEDQGAIPVEVYSCKYNDGMGPADLDAVVAKWNAWADERGMNDYSAWTLTPFYAGPDQDFDVIWMGVAKTAQGLGAAQDDWLANGGELAAEFDRVSPCDSHSNFAALEFKAPPDNDDPPDNVVISFSDCNIEDGKSFANDVAPAIAAWAEFRAAQGSEAGHWVFFPVYGGGGEEYDFKYVTGHRSYEQQGIDYDNYDPDKARELFSGLLDCDSSRVYNATNRRRAANDEE